MIYVCIPCHDEAPTVGLLLWKVRQVFTGFPREYQLLVADDASTDHTSELLEPYARVLPLTVVRHEVRRGYARSVETLLRLAMQRTDRPRRDCAILMHADFSHGAQFLPDLVKRVDSGADLVVGEGKLSGEPSRARRLVRRWASLMLKSRVRVPEVSDLVSGFVAFRLSVLRHALSNGEPLLTTDGWAANAELIGRAARQARRIETVATVERHDLRKRASRVEPWQMLRDLWRARRELKLPPPELESEARAAEPAEVASG